MVPPVDPFQGGEFDLLDAAPGPTPFDQFGLEQPVDGLGERVIKAVPAAADRAGDAELGEPVGIANRQILLRFKGSLQQWLVVRLRVGDRSGLRRGCAIPVSCGDGRSMQ